MLPPQSGDWELRCWQLVCAFAETMNGLLSPEERAHGGYMAEDRRGELSFQALITLSIGAVRVATGECESHREVAAAASVAKKQAKKKARNPTGEDFGGSVFIERRRPGAGEVAVLTAHALN